MDSKLFKQLLKEGKEFVVKISNARECNELLELCDKQNIKWFMGERALEFNPYNENAKDLIYITFEKYRFATLMRYATDKKFCSVNNIKEVKFEDLFKPYINQEIHITRKGNEVYGILKENGKVTNRSVAKCHPEDKFDFKICSQLAYDKLFEEDEQNYLNCRFVLATNIGNYLTKGRIYEVVNGQFQNDNGSLYPATSKPLQTQDDLLNYLSHGESVVILED